MKEKMVITKGIYRIKVVGYDENGLCWSFKFWDTVDQAIEQTKEILKDYKREHYEIVVNV